MLAHARVIRWPGVDDAAATVNPGIGTPDAGSLLRFLAVDMIVAVRGPASVLFADVRSE